MGGEGREGDWECSGCGNRNYAFRTYCNRCKQPRILVDTKTPADSKWLPRIGDWICAGCTNNNYASREKCKKCGQPKEIAAMPAIAMHGASLPTHPYYFARAQGGLEQNINIGLLGTGALQQSLPVSSNWSLGGADKCGIQHASTWSLGGNNSSGLPYNNQATQLLLVPKGWRNGDWICNCGFHNYSSRAQCKKCNASMPPAIGTKRLASEELVHDWDNKRLNAGQALGLQQAYPAFEQEAVSGGNQTTGVYNPAYHSGSPSMAPNLPVNLQFPHVAATPTLLGKGAKQWRDGDWMCTNCSNHNYASRSQCNRCKTQKDSPAQAVTIA
ncbi:RNA-binding protein involved in heterochromatin assembly dri1-like [Actinidia eriantha]|uniref:RNA-binding protein involved in heterochromatin assembly dri1-like n=1 Tax=Actinidia eriantha TaxID=165200 RepID=UPI0025906F11|nr:RNA-binding protein involved in heterochromatin assembly dri1-like [Actinidia eriantha]